MVAAKHVDEGAGRLVADPIHDLGHARVAALEHVSGRARPPAGQVDLTAGDASSEHLFVVVRGTLAEADPHAAQTQHDEVAAGGEEAVRAAGDVAHVVYVGLQDERELLAIDVWTSRDAIEAVYSDPNFVAAFGALFAAPPTVAVYASTDWHQW